MKELPLLLLCAGKSERMGQPKGLVPFAGGLWIEEQLRRAPVARVYVVLGFHAERYREALAEKALFLVDNPSPERGMFSSLQCGLRALAPGEGTFVLPIDVPAAEPSVWRELEIAVASGAPAALPTYEGRGGHPVALSSTTVTHLLTLSADARLDEALRALSPARLPCEDANITTNLNDPAAFALLKTNLVGFKDGG